MAEPSPAPPIPSAGPWSPGWMEAVPAPGRPTTATPDKGEPSAPAVKVDVSVPPLKGELSSPLSPKALPTHPPLVAPPRPSRRATVRRPAPHASPQAPPRERSVPEPDRQAPPPPPPPSVRAGGHDPCATFDDFRRQPCYSFLDRLTR
ncbi:MULTISPECIES: hypothetical protein [unclassified Nonomuraea]|uniref:hypothetical protein n=1 Tax=Nonomuraea sp. NPDC047529 TaxID=3155623 RepID=UPI0033D40872